jgi:hypothetical protein
VACSEVLLLCVVQLLQEVRRSLAVVVSEHRVVVAISYLVRFIWLILLWILLCIQPVILLIWIIVSHEISCSFIMTFRSIQNIARVVDFVAVDIIALRRMVVLNLRRHLVLRGVVKLASFANQVVLIWLYFVDVARLSEFDWSWLNIFSRVCREVTCFPDVVVLGVEVWRRDVLKVESNVFVLFSMKLERRGLLLLVAVDGLLAELLGKWGESMSFLCRVEGNRQSLLHLLVVHCVIVTSCSPETHSLLTNSSLVYC